MSASEQARDANRWVTYERILTPESGAAESERIQARARLDELRAKYPAGKPAQQQAPPPASTWSPFTGYAYYDNFGGFRRPQYEEGPDAKAAREAADRQRKEAARVESVRRQRAQIENVPDWRAVEALHEFHRCESAWSDDDKRRAKDLARPQWTARPLTDGDRVTLYRDLSIVYAQPLTNYDRAQLTAIVLAAGGGGRIHMGHERWLIRRV